MMEATDRPGLGLRDSARNTRTQGYPSEWALCGSPLTPLGLTVTTQSELESSGIYTDSPSVRFSTDLLTHIDHDDHISLPYF